MNELTGLETLLIGGGLTLASGAISAGLVWVKYAKEKMSVDKCTDIRERIEEAHRTGCPMSHSVLTEPVHRQICTDRTEPIIKTVDRIEKKLDHLMEKLM